MPLSELTIALIIPTYNAEKDIPALFEAIMQQSLKPNHILVIDSSSTDNTQKLLSSFPVTIHTIKQRDFDHGGTRKLGTQLIDADIYIYLTQDAIPANPASFNNLVHTLMHDEKTACAYGRQLPKENATPLSAHSRLCNYPAQSQVRTYADKDKYGIKTCFNSDSFAAYKKLPLLEAGNFPDHLILGEDVYVAGKLLKKGYSIAYAADAMVSHSHNLSLLEEFHRYFSIGVFHGSERWIVKEFNAATREGIHFIQSEFTYLITQRKFLWIPKAFLSTFVKFFAYHLGMREQTIPYFIKKSIGINKSFWLKRKNAPTHSN